MAADGGQEPGHFLPATVFLVSATALAYEILLIRLLSIIQYHHFAYLIISLALLGYGASGTFLSLFQERLVPRYREVVPLCCMLFALALPLCFWAAQSIGFNAEAFFWDWRQMPRLMGIYVLLAVPFFFAALVLAISFRAREGAIASLYACDLSGAAAGGAASLLLLFVLYPERLLLVLPLGGLAAVVLAAASPARRVVRPLALLAALTFLLLPPGATVLKPSPYKGLPQLLRVRGCEVVARRSSPLADLKLVECRKVPLRHAPGLSIAATGAIPEQLALFTDNDAVSAITRFSGEAESLSFLDQTTMALPFHLNKPAKAVILGAGTGSDVLLALFHGVESIEAVELNPQVIDLVQEYEALSGGIYDRAQVTVRIGEGRGFVKEAGEAYDLIQLSLLDSFSSSSAGLHGLQESYLYTVEAFIAYLGHLRPGGFLAVSRWVKVPPRDGLKLAATAIDALQALGVADPAARLLLVRGWQTSTLIVKNGDFEEAEIERARAFCQARFFDLAYYPGMARAEANRFNILAEPFFYDGVSRLLSAGREEFVARYKLDIRPATDDRPYFFDFFKWRTLPELLRAKGRGGLGQMEWGYLILAATLVQAVVASTALVLLPLFFLRRKGGRAGAGPVFRVFSYFSAIGLAFLFLEIGLVQKTVLYLHHPLYAAALVISVVLVFAGLGSRVAGRASEGRDGKVAARLAVVGIIGCSALYILFFAETAELLLHLSMPLRVLCTVLLLAPASFCMGMPFPIGLSRLAQLDSRLVPWAWGVNGCASVISAVLAMLLAVHFGFDRLLGAALALYVLALPVLPGPLKTGQD